jgi:hypothetical protein
MSSYVVLAKFDPSLGCSSWPRYWLSLLDPVMDQSHLRGSCMECKELIKGANVLTPRLRASTGIGTDDGPLERKGEGAKGRKGQQTV